MCTQMIALIDNTKKSFNKDDQLHFRINSNRKIAFKKALQKRNKRISTALDEFIDQVIKSDE